MRAALIAAALICAASQPGAAQSISLGFPVDCDLGETCFIQQFVDHDPGPKASDAFCGPQTYDGHKGTDIALPTLRDMENGVSVLAAAPGVVRGLRDGMADAYYTPNTEDDIRGRECGNGVLIDHAGGWQTQYCHLKQGSIVVQTGDKVEPGTLLGQVGLSGRTQFPHLHLSLRKDGAVVDPFDPDGKIDCLAPSADTLWQEPLTPQPGGIIALGFADHVPTFDAIKAGTADTRAFAVSAPAMVVYAYAFGGRAGDILALRLTGPGGEVAQQELTLEKTQAQLFRAIGRRARADWPVGRYFGTAQLMRDGKTLDTKEAFLEVK